METRYNAPYLPIQKVQDIECPPKKTQSFENYLVAVENNNKCSFNFKFKQGEKSNLKSSEPLKEIMIEPDGTEVKRAIVWYNPANT